MCNIHFKLIPMKSLVISSFLVLFFSTVYSQEQARTADIERNTVYVEAFGQGLAWSANYDRLFNTNKTFMNSLTVGITYVPEFVGFGVGDTYVGIPVSYNWLLGKKSHHLELGVGLTSMFVIAANTGGSDIFYLAAAPKVGYRFQRPQGGLFFKATVTALIDVFHVDSYSFLNDRYSRLSYFNDVLGIGYPVFPWPGVSVGYTFK